MKTPDYSKETYSEEEILTLEKDLIKDFGSAWEEIHSLLDDDFDSIPDDSCIYFPSNSTNEEE